MNKEITFYTGVARLNFSLTYEDTKHQIQDKSCKKINTTQLTFLSFDLFEQGFSKITLVHTGKEYDLKLGSNTWTTKELRKEHNLLKLVTGYILNNETENPLMVGSYPAFDVTKQSNENKIKYINSIL